MVTRRRSVQFYLTSVIVITAIFLGAGDAHGREAAAARGSFPPITTQTGTLSIIWGDPRPGQTGEGQIRAFLTDDGGRTVELELNEQTLRQAGGLSAVNGRRVTVSSLSQPDHAAGFVTPGADAPPIVPLTISPGASSPSTAVSGSFPFVSILCKFPDILQEQRDLGYFRDMYGSADPGLDHYWNELSYGQINLEDSNAFGWYLLPRNRGDYFRADGKAKLGELFGDCAGAADAAVDFSAVAGINLMFNAELDGFAWGGTIYKELDGQARFWRATWEPPWAFENITVMAHEMGHTFGLPHSSGSYGKVYDNRWDVMSDTWTDCYQAMDAVYGCLGQHTIAFHKGIMGWLDGRIYTALQESQTIVLDRLANPGSSDYLAAKIPIDKAANRFYTVEARQRTGYDNKLPFNGVVIHEVDLSRDHPAHVIDIDLNGDTGDDGALWLPGETFSGEAGISVSIDSGSGTGYTVTIERAEAVEVPLAQTFFLSTTQAGKMNGLPFNPSDILRYDAVDGLSMLFDGSDVGIAKNLSAFSFDENGTILLALAGAQNVGGLGTVKQQEIFRFIPTSLGENTAGTFEWVLRRADSELTTTAEKVDALAEKSAVCWTGDDSRGLMVSTNGRAVVSDLGGTKFRAQDEDVMLRDTAWSAYFDGSKVAGLGREDVNGLWQDPITCDLYVTILGAFNLGGVRGNGKDIIKLDAAVNGNGAAAVSYTPSLFWDGSAAGFPQNLDGIEFPNTAFP